MPIFIILLFILDIYSIFIVTSVIGSFVSFIIVLFFMLLGIFLIKNLNNFSYPSINKGLIKNFFNLTNFNFVNLLSSFYILISAILFIIPGFLSDILGTFILIKYFFSKKLYKNNKKFHYDYKNNSIIEGKFKEYK